jgi:hypothetical protein
MSRGPSIATVCDAKQYQRLRHLIHSIRETQGLNPEIYVINVGLNDAQVEALVVANIRPVKVIRGTPDETPMPQLFMYKAFADLYCPSADPLIVCDNDLEFRAPGALAELFERAKRGMFICEEIYGWASNLSVHIECMNADPVARAFIQPQAHLLLQGPIVNAGLFGGPRNQMVRFLQTARLLIPGGLKVWHWFWEQVAFNWIVKLDLVPVKVLPTEMNWITHWGENPNAKVWHFSGGTPGFRGESLRVPLPDGYLDDHRYDQIPWVAPGTAPQGLEVLPRARIEGCQE